MRFFSNIILSLVLLSCVALAQDGTAVNQVRAASQTLAQQEKDGLLIAWLSRGRVAGESVAARLVNQSNKPIEVNLLPGMILEDPNGKFQPFMLETSLTLTLAPGQTKELEHLRAYNVDHSKDPGADGTHYPNKTVVDIEPYTPAIKALWAGLRRSADNEMHPVVTPLLHKTIVIQRAIWASLGDPNPTTLERLEQDLKNDDRAADHPHTEHKSEWIAGRLWKDVSKTLEASKAE